MSTSSVPLSGRRGEALRNDRLILDAAREVFTADPGAPIAEVAHRAGVGIGALYRRYRSKDELLQQLALEGLQRYMAATESALANEEDPWGAFAGFMRRCLDDGVGSLSVRLAGSFPPTEELQRLGREADKATRLLVERTKRAGELRPDIEASDVQLTFEQLQSIRVGDQERSRSLRHRYLALILDALHTSPAPRSDLPGPPPRWEEIVRRYDKGG